MSDLIEKAINRLAREAHFKLEIALMRDDRANGTVSTNVLNNQIWRLARAYDMPPWLVRGLVEQDTP